MTGHWVQFTYCYPYLNGKISMLTCSVCHGILWECRAINLVEIMVDISSVMNLLTSNWMYKADIQAAY